MKSLILIAILWLLPTMATSSHIDMRSILLSSHHIKSDIPTFAAKLAYGISICQKRQVVSILVSTELSTIPKKTQVLRILAAFGSSEIKAMEYSTNDKLYFIDIIHTVYDEDITPNMILEFAKEIRIECYLEKNINTT